MDIDRVAGFAPKTRALAESLAHLNGPCIGCKDCLGLCQSLIDLMQLPELVLKGGPA